MNNDVIVSNGELRASIGFDKDEEMNLATNIDSSHHIGVSIKM